VSYNPRLRAVTDTNYNTIKEVIYDTFGTIVSDTNSSFNVPFGFGSGDSIGGVDPSGLKTFNCQMPGVGGHHYNCVEKDGVMVCQSLYPSQDVAFPNIYMPHFGLPSVSD